MSDANSSTVIKIGDFVTSYHAGYWQLIDLKPMIASHDYSSENVSWKKGDNIGQWAIMKKAFTPKMKPRIDFQYVNTQWLRPVATEVQDSIDRYFRDNPAYKEKFDTAELKLPPSVTSCWINVPPEKEENLQQLLDQLPPRYTSKEFWDMCSAYRCYVSQKPPTSHLLSFCCLPWDMDEELNVIFSRCELHKL